MLSIERISSADADVSAILTAEEVFAILQGMPASEREKFFALLAQHAFPATENFSREAVFGHLNGAQFSASEAAQYLDVSIATFRRYVRAGKIRASSEVGTSHLYPLTALRELKQALTLLHGELATA